jgi:L,D-peptidoglycan transpeptidase YkuD (ErfK/YbiS/YcfS/YnhG family)
MRSLTIPRLPILIAVLIAPMAAAWAAPIPSACRQLIVSVADTWDSSSGTLLRFERTNGKWRPVPKPVRVLFGKNGLAWGIGVAGQDEAGKRKVEGDNRAPAGIFALGRAYGYAPSLPNAAGYPYHKVAASDAWIEDPDHPLYNQYVRVNPENPPTWFKAAQMKQNDPAHKWKVEIRHNADPPQPGMGSAIFFHIWRGENRFSAGCTTMSESAILEMIAWLNPDAFPHYVLLPRTEYASLQGTWKLPDLP